ncbi:hypothetical protein AVEN_65497-1 [Araneus ventricosus]|uniref:Uncharacterized protein n=1 Tax=Araneus ventricosus TaxID=182803 RepID=A0A4Y2JI78_ARAVE|nr:hypothetical protein AVEN_65497-1 [Araneus ventricosus]
MQRPPLSGEDGGIRVTGARDKGAIDPPPGGAPEYAYSVLTVGLKLNFRYGTVVPRGWGCGRGWGKKEKNTSSSPRRRRWRKRRIVRGRRAEIAFSVAPV